MFGRMFISSGLNQPDAIATKGYGDRGSGRRPRVMQLITHLALGGAERVALNLMHGLRDRVDFGLFSSRAMQDDQVGQAMKREVEELGAPLYFGTNLPIKCGG